MADGITWNKPTEARKTAPQARLWVWLGGYAETSKARCVALCGALLPYLRLWGL